MLYQRPQFTLPTTNKIMTPIEYEVSVGVRCPICLKLTKKTDEKRSKQCRCKSEYYAPSK